MGFNSGFKGLIYSGLHRSKEREPCSIFLLPSTHRIAEYSGKHTRY